MVVVGGGAAEEVLAAVVEADFLEEMAAAVAEVATA